MYSDDLDIMSEGNIARLISCTIMTFYGRIKTCIYLNGKAVPLQAWSDPEGYRKLRFPDFMTTAKEGSKVFSLTHRPHLPPGNPPGTHLY